MEFEWEGHQLRLSETRFSKKTLKRDSKGGLLPGQEWDCEMGPARRDGKNQQAFEWRVGVQTAALLFVKKWISDSKRLFNPSRLDGSACSGASTLASILRKTGGGGSGPKTWFEMMFSKEASPDRIGEELQELFEYHFDNNEERSWVSLKPIWRATRIRIGVYRNGTTSWDKVDNVTEVAEELSRLLRPDRKAGSDNLPSPAPGSQVVVSPKTFEELISVFGRSSVGQRIINFEPKIRQWTSDFVGRDAVFRKVEDSLAKLKNAFSSGYILILGEPGIGKTAVLAEFIRRQSCIHHFNIAVQGLRSVSDFRKNVCAQVIARYALPYDQLPPDAQQGTECLSRLLIEASHRQEDQPVIVAIDALDEAEDDVSNPYGNRLSLPDALPRGVYFVITMRWKGDLRLNVKPLETFSLDDMQGANEVDAAKFVERFIRKYPMEMKRALVNWKVDERQFTAVLVRKSETNFMYLVKVLEAVRDGRLDKAALDSIDNLPDGLVSYYERHWRMMQEQLPQQFNTLYRPVVCFLSAVKEPVSIERLAAYAKLSHAQVSKVITEWHEFFNRQTNESNENLYSIYHLSFLEFVRERVDLLPYKSQIASAILDKVPGW